MKQGAVHEIVQRVAGATGRDVSELPPLHDAIDPDAVDAITECDAARLQFVYCDHAITIEVRDPGDYRVTVHPESPDVAPD